MLRLQRLDPRAIALRRSTQHRLLNVRWLGLRWYAANKALDLGVGDGVSLIPQQSEPSLWLNSDGYYWFLHPLIEKLQSETGQYIDLYGDASFFSASLSALEQMVAEAIRLVQAQPASWQVHTGTQMSPEHKELYAEVNKVQFLSLLHKWREIIARAKELGKPVVCFGD